MADHLQSDDKLIHRLIAQDQSALAELYQAYGALVYSLALQILGHSDSAEEVTQDVFLKAWNQAERWNPDRGRLSTWLMMMARSAALDRLRKDRARPLGQASALDPLEELLMSEGGAGDGLGQAAWYDKSLLHSLLAQLPPDQRLPLELAFWEGLPHSELAARLQIPLGTLKSRIRAGLLRLKELWKDSLEKSDDL
jgi:RNA polymerase sigma-70 factor (ECF subfamily)